MEFVIFTFRTCVSSLEISHDIIEGDIILSLIEGTFLTVFLSKNIPHLQRE